MAELEKKDIYACALSMPTPEAPLWEEWVEEISRHVNRNPEDELFLVGHSLGTPAILKYLENAPTNVKISGAVLVSGPCSKTDNRSLDNFLETPFNFRTIKSKCSIFTIIHGDDDPYVPL